MFFKKKKTIAGVNPGDDNEQSANYAADSVDDKLKVALKMVTAQEIYNEIKNIEQELYDEADAILKQDVKDDLDEIEKLYHLGFVRSGNIVEKLNQKERINAAKNIINLIKRYRDFYPGKLFLTNDKIETICKKYGLLFGKSNYFLGNIPAINRKEILNFKIKDEDCCYYTYYNGNRIWVSEEYYSKRTDEDKKDYSKGIFFYVIANREQFNLICKEIIDGYEIVNKDPIVLAECNGGYLVITKWDDVD